MGNISIEQVMNLSGFRWKKGADTKNVPKRTSGSERSFEEFLKEELQRLEGNMSNEAKKET